MAKTIIKLKLLVVCTAILGCLYQLIQSIDILHIKLYASILILLAGILFKTFNNKNYTSI